MNKDAFLRHIENSRDCEQERLETAVKKGLARAKSDRLDSWRGLRSNPSPIPYENNIPRRIAAGNVDARKLLMLAAASVFTLVMCFTVNLRPFRMAVDDYHRSWNKIPPGSVEVLDGYIKDIANTIERYLGGK